MIRVSYIGESKDYLSIVLHSTIPEIGGSSCRNERGLGYVFITESILESNREIKPGTEVV